MLSSLNPLPQLPKYKGPYKVGSTEYEIPVSEIPSSTRVPDASVGTIKFRIFYPTSDSVSSKRSIPWLPQPQKEWNRAYAKFGGLSERSSSVVANMPSLLNYATIPASQNAPVLQSPTSQPWPVAIFSHGLGGNYNTYSSFVGSLASCGMIVVVPEHRDESAPVSFIKPSHEKPGRQLAYRRFSHSPTVKTLNGRNDMLRIRTWELEQLYTTVTSMNRGQAYTNLADSTSNEIPQFTKTMDFTHGKVTWAGHSFGAATMIQFIKSIYYRQHAPAQTSTDEAGWDWTSLYTPSEGHDLIKQITSESPMILLDLWTLPLTSETTHWLWERPLPCYDRKNDDPMKAAPNVISIMSTQFFKWNEMVNRTKAVLSEKPVEVYKMLSEQSDAKGEDRTEPEDVEIQSPQSAMDPITKLETSEELESVDESRTTRYEKPEARNISQHLSVPSPTSSRTPSPAKSGISSTSSTTDAQASSPSPQSSLTSLPVTNVPDTSPQQSPVTGSESLSPQLYMIHGSAHLSQSDFGVLFPRATKYFLKTQNPDEIMALNVKGALKMLRGAGIDVKELKKKKKSEKKSSKSGTEDTARWERLNIPVV